MQTLKIMKQFMEPQSVALIGVSRSTGEGAFNILENLLSYGYRGKIYPINPNVNEILGVKTYPSITDVADDIDLAVITTPRSLVPELVNECAENNIKAIVIVAQGFSDANDREGKKLQKEINNIAQTKQIRILGPNTLGTANAFINFSSSFTKMIMKRHPIGIICQSGVFFVGFPDMAFVGKGIDLGNATDINFADGLEYFESDSEINVVALHLEGTQDARRFISTARRISRIKPIVVLKTGKSEQAAKTAQSHTSSLTGSAEVWQAALKQSGVIQADDLEELIDLARTFSTLPLMERTKIGVVTLSGGFGIIAIDGCQYTNLEISSLAPNTKKLIAKMSPSWLKINNPVDIWPAMMTAQPSNKPLIDSLEILLSDPELGAVLFLGGTFDEKWSSDLPKRLNELATAHQNKPLVCCIWGHYGNEAINKLHAMRNAVGFPTPERAVRALARLNEYSSLRGRL